MYPACAFNVGGESSPRLSPARNLWCRTDTGILGSHFVGDLKTKRQLRNGVEPMNDSFQTKPPVSGSRVAVGNVYREWYLKEYQGGRARKEVPVVVMGFSVANTLPLSVWLAVGV